MHEDDELQELPPLDGDSGDPPNGEGDYGDLLEEATEQATLDDTTGEDDPADGTDLDLDDEKGGWLGEAGEAPELDLAAMDIVMIDFGTEATNVDDGEEAGAVNEDFGFVDAPERGGMDAAEEGPVDADEELHEADLPALDADEEGELDDAALVDVAFASDEPLGLPWATRPWVRVGSPVGVFGVTAIACAARGALVAGRGEGAPAGLLKVDLEGTCERLAAAGLEAAEVRGLAVDGDFVAAMVDEGRLLVSRDAGQRFEPVAEPIVATDAVFAALVRAAGRETDASLNREAMNGPEARSPALFAVRGEHVAYAARRGGIVRRSGSAPWASLEWDGRVTALAFVDDVGAIVVATYAESDDTTALVLVDAAGTTSVVARVGAVHADADSDGRVMAMAHDQARGVVWVGGAFGIAAFATR